MQKNLLVVLMGLLAAFAQSAFATAISVDVSAVTEQLLEINTAVAAVGAALLVAAAIAVTFKWAKATIFG